MTSSSLPPARAGRPWPLGAMPCVQDGLGGLHLAVHAPHAERVELCLFDDAGHETARLPLPARTGGVHHGFWPGLGEGLRYGLRAHGPWHPEAGHRFNPACLLIDPMARSLPGSVDGLAQERGHDGDDLRRPRPDDNAARIPRARVIDWALEREAGARLTPGPQVSPARRVWLEAHVRALTQRHPELPPELRGSYAALASEPMLRHYRRLGITGLCLLPVARHLDERHLLERGLRNHWGYNPLAAFVPEPRYASAAAQAAARRDGPDGDRAVRDEFRTMVDTLHRHGLEVMLDVVHNHSAEGDLHGPTLSWRGLDHAAWYALDANGQPLNPSGCGNTFHMGSPGVLQMVLDSLRWWVEVYGVDGFRFDLAVALGRDPARGGDFHPMAPLLAALAQDPVLARVVCVAEPWDLGPGGHRLGAFGGRWAEWNDRFRDGVRAWWLGHPCTRGEFARRLSGSADVFEPGGRPPTASVNMVTAHDGFTLADLTSHRDKHNEANGENNRDGHDHNLSANGGHEGPSDDPAILARRGRWRRALLATLLSAQGTPQLLAGDELGHSQGGNNNAYCQDNPITWLDWSQADSTLPDFIGGLTRWRAALPAWRHAQAFRGRPLAGSAWPDIEWRNADGSAPDVEAWEHPNGRLLVAVIAVGDDGAAPRERVCLAWHAHEQTTTLTLPPGRWTLLLDSGRAWVAPPPGPDGLPPPGLPRFEGRIDLGPQTVLALHQPLEPDATPGNTPS